MIEEIKTGTTEEWEKYRRPELLTLYRENVYGYCPFPVPETVTGVIQDTERTEDCYIREEELLYIEQYPMPITLSIRSSEITIRIIRLLFICVCRIRKKRIFL